MPTTIVDLARQRAGAQPSAIAYLFFEDDADDGYAPTTPVTYAELDIRARAIGAALAGQAAAGQPVLLLYPPGPDYVAGFLGCLYAGAVAVPAYPPDPTRLDRTLPRLRSLVTDCGARLALSLASITEQVSWLADQAPELAALDWLATDTIPDGNAAHWHPPAGMDGDSPALLQYTSGSTGTPRGVQLRHANLLHNAGLVQLGFATSPDAVGVSWLPPYHDMGLIGGIVQPLYAGFPVVLMSPLTFLRRPLTWLEVISGHRATMSGGPNFAFDLCVRRTTPQQRAALDLSPWRLAFCGAEPIRAQTLDRFATAFAPAGFRSDVFYPCYGLAEATLIVTGGAPRRIGGSVACGRPLGDQRLVVVDPDTATPRPAGVEGEIWLSGPSVAAGYWRRPAETAAVFDARLPSEPGRRYLRTGDLGYLDGSGELVVTGRIKDLIIVRGRNIYPQDLEYAVEQRVPGVRPGCTAAFPVVAGDEERVGVACEVRDHDSTDAGPVVAAIRQAVAETAEVTVAVVVLLRHGRVPKTSSGKIQRHACRAAVTAGHWRGGHEDVLAYWDDVADAATVDEGAASATGPGQAPADRRPTDGQPASVDAPTLAIAAGRILGLPPEAVPAEQALTSLGLDSLRAIELQGVLEHQYGLAVPLADLLTGVSLTELAARQRRPHAQTGTSPGAGRHAGAGSHAGAGRHAGAGSGAEAADDAGRGNQTGAGRGAPPRAHSGQRALWLLQRWAPDSTAYQISKAARIRSPLDLGALERSLAAVVRRHECLRTRLPAAGGEPAPVVSDWTGPVLQQHDATGLTGPELRRWVQAVADQRFDLERGPLLRVALFSRAPADHVMLLSLHHTITDFWSLSVMVDEVLAGYAAECGRAAGQTAPVADRPTTVERPRRSTPPATGQAAAPATGQAAAPAAAPTGWRAYWREILADAPTLELPTSFPRPRLQSFRGASHQFRLAPQTLRRLDRLAADAQVSRFAILAAGFAALLGRYTGEPDVIVGAPVAGRGGADHDRLGYFVRPVPLRLRPAPAASFRQLAQHARQVVIDALSHAVPFPDLVAEVAPVRDPARSPVLQAMLVLQQAPSGRPDLGAFAVGDEQVTINRAGLALSPYRLAERGSPFDLSVMLAEVAGGLTGELIYATDLFDAPTMERFARHLANLLDQASRDPDAPLSALDLLAGSERARVLEFATGATEPFPDQQTLPDLFAARTRTQPAALAVAAGGQQLSYAELDTKAELVAGLLQRRYGVGRGDLVGVHLPRTLDVAVAFWAALKAGGAYLPLAADLPPARLAWLLDDARPAVVLTHRRLAGRLPEQIPRLCLDAVDDLGPAGESTADALPPVTSDAGPTDLAYVLYTSGSTGRPKAVMLPHRGAVNLAQSEINGLEITPDSRLLQFASLAYDVHVSEILTAHLSGASLYVADQDAAVPGPALIDLLRRHRITHLWQSPSVLAALGEVELSDLTHILCGGEACPAEVVRQWAPGRRFFNGYGPAETTVCASWQRCQPQVDTPPIGRPLPNQRVYVLTEELGLVPVGVPGEICVGGAGVGWGYLSRPGLTADRFRPDPYHPAPGARLYRTGDRGRWLPDGAVEFLGRLDDQVKIRGVRVEPGEVAARLKELLEIRDAAVVARETPAGATELVAYLVTGGERRPVAELRGLLRAELAEPWLPAAFVYLDALPLNRSGKLDRRALPAPTPADRGRSRPLPARTDLERLISSVWAQLLGLPEVGVRDHFFDQLGGSSLLVARVTAELATRLGRPVPVTWLFEHPTVEALARRLTGDDPDDGRGPAAPSPEDRAARRRRALHRRSEREQQV